MLIRKSDPTVIPSNTSVYKKPGGGTVSNFHRLSVQERIDNHGVYPVTGEPQLTWWQTKSDPQYTFNDSAAEVSYTIIEMPFSERQDALIAQTYQMARALISGQEQGYAQSEIATWPMMRTEIKQYLLDSSVGEYMQAVISEGAHDASSLVALLGPKVSFYNAVIAERNEKVLMIRGAEDQSDLDMVDIASGWPTLEGD